MCEGQSNDKQLWLYIPALVSSTWGWLALPGQDVCIYIHPTYTHASICKAAIHVHIQMYLLAMHACMHACMAMYCTYVCSMQTLTVIGSIPCTYVRTCVYYAPGALG